MDNFTFCILTYNHEKYIIDTLESIKYQIVNYGNDISINLIIGNDNSTDHTLDLVLFWLKTNKRYFHSIDLINNEKNIGACKTIVKMFENVKTEQFKLIEGDDLFSNVDIFSLFKKHKNNNIVSCTSLQFYNYQIIDSKEKYISVISKKLLNKSLIKILTTVSVPFNGTSMWYSKKLVSPNMLNRLDNYFVIGDRTIWFSILHDFKLESIKYAFEEEPIILYRYNEFSITSQQSSKRSFYLNDYENYISSIKNEKLNLAEKILYNSFILSKKYNLVYLNLLAYINKFLDKFSWIITNKSINKLIVKIPIQQNYLLQIKDESSKILKEFYDKKN